jgi:integration host factor subunit beta
MTKSDLISRISLDKGISKARAELAVNMVFECLTQAMIRNERVEIRGLGSFEIRNYGSYKGRNPRTGDAVPVRPKRLPFFKAGKEIKDLINTKHRRTIEVSTVAEPPPARISAKAR